MPDHDVIIIGAGHNGLTAGNLIARAGLDLAELDTLQATEPFLDNTGFSDPEFDDTIFAEGGGSIHMTVEPGSDDDCRR